MICKKLKNAILQSCEEMENAMYNYGIACAQIKTLDFRAVGFTFDQLKFSSSEKDAYTRKIIKGFCKGLGPN